VFSSCVCIASVSVVLCNYVDTDVDYVNGGEMFTHLYQRERFTEAEVRIYIAEIVLALERLHSVRISSLQ